MPSSFPGMDPYLEQEGVFGDFRRTFIVTLRASLTRQLGGRYFARLAEAPPLPMGQHGRIAAVEEGNLILEIRALPDHSLVTVVEMLSPSDKRDESRHEKYLARREEAADSGVNHVEIDLLRGGRRIAFAAPADSDYRVVVTRPVRRPEVAVWPVGLRGPLPVIPIPLRPTEVDLYGHLQNVLDQVYDSAGYSAYIYRGRPDPPLRPEDAGWAARFVPGTKAGGDE